jgi:uncharacterized membrane protein YphA (DoxX/SURF4 family)
MVTGIAVVSQAATALWGDASVRSTILNVLILGVGILLLLGLWTPVGGIALAILALWKAFLRPADPWTDILLGSVGTALALLGPGAWSVDARLFGWKRIELPDRKS